MKTQIVLSILTASITLAQAKTVTKLAPNMGITSQYTNFEIKKCKNTSYSEEDGGGVWKCKGIEDFGVNYSEGDLRGTLSFGPNGENQCSAKQSFGHFNSPGKKIEWRVQWGIPIATIVRWHTSNGEPNSNQDWLVVTRININDRQSCRTAFIDTKYPKANLEARKAADKSGAFKCNQDVPIVLSATQMKVEDFATGIPCPK